jgi:predicted nucleic acid-binding protein
MTSYLIDTNILIYYLAGAIPDEEKPVIDRILQESFNIPIITRIELLAGKTILLKDLPRHGAFSIVPAACPSPIPSQRKRSNFAQW